MVSRIQMLAILGSILLAFFIFELIRKKKLLEKYSLLWLGSAIVLIVLSIWRDLLEKISDSMGVYYAPTALFIVVLFCGLILGLHITIVISKLTEQNKILAQEISLLKNKIEEGREIEK